MKGLTRGTPPSIAIDTNIFYHLENPDINADGHITDFMGSDTGDTHLLLDKAGLIQEEYRYHIWNGLLQQNQRIFGTRQIILHWMGKIFPKEGKQVVVIEVDVDESDDLWGAIVPPVPEDEREDATFVYMAFIQGRTLITNDKDDILRHRERLESQVQEAGVFTSAADVLSSEEAHHKWKTLQQGGESGGTGQD